MGKCPRTYDGAPENQGVGSSILSWATTEPTENADDFCQAPELSTHAAELFVANKRIHRYERKQCRACRPHRHSCGWPSSPSDRVQFDEAHEIDVVERSIRIIRPNRQTYPCRGGARIETTLGPEKSAAGGPYSIDLAVGMAIANFPDHMLLERQVQQVARTSSSIPRGEKRQMLDDGPEFTTKDVRNRLQHA